MIGLALLVAAKDLRIEWRSRVLLWQVLPFAVMALLLAALAVGPSSVEMRRVAPGVFYLVVLLASLLIIGRSHAVEQPVGTRTSVRMLGLDPAAAFLGKTLALFVELVATGLVVAAGGVLLLHAPLAGTAEAAPGMLLSLAALAAGGTLYGALVGDSSSQNTLLPIIALPPFAAILVLGEKAYASSLDGGALARWLISLGVAAVAYLALGTLLYGVSEESS